jgi:hypothetical protein
MGARLKKIRMNDFAQFWVRHSWRLSIDDRSLFDIGMIQAFEQEAGHGARLNGWHVVCSEAD